MYVIGISAYYHDSSVALFQRGELVFACEEEKFTGIKHDSSFPKIALTYLVKKYKLNKDNIEAVCFYENPDLKKSRIVEYSKKMFLINPILAIKNYVSFLIKNNQLKKELKKLSNNIFYSNHHHSHLYYSAFSSPFKECAVVSIDGVGEYDTTTISYYEKNKLNVENISEYPHSLGLFYSALTSFLGFKPNEGEYKMMGLAPYGTHSNLVDKVSKLVYFKNGKIINNLEYFKWDKSDKIMFNYKLSNLLNILPRLPEEEITQDHMNLAFAVQHTYEKVFFDLLKYVQTKYNTTNICLGGGCAYNGSANGKIYYKTSFENVWIPPAPSDAGSAIGCVINYYINSGKRRIRIPETPFLGPSFRITPKFKEFLSGRKFLYLRDDSIFRLIAGEIKKGKVVGWFKDEIEFGARALGHRSILADPTNPTMKKRINDLVKKREGFRPFAPMVIKERQNDFFHIFNDVPYMNQVVKVKDEYKNILKSVTHIDGTARVQTVTKNMLVYKLLKEFERVSGYPILLNTSFNIKDRTMVLTPLQSLYTFDEVDIDILVLHNFVIFKTKKNDTKNY